MRLFTHAELRLPNFLENDLAVGKNERVAVFEKLNVRARIVVGVCCDAAAFRNVSGINDRNRQSLIGSGDSHGRHLVGAKRRVFNRTRGGYCRETQKLKTEKGYEDRERNARSKRSKKDEPRHTFGLAVQRVEPFPWNIYCRALQRARISF